MRVPEKRPLATPTGSDRHFNARGLYCGAVTETTEAPATLAPAEAAVTALRRQLEGRQSVSSSVVQDGLLDVWAALPEGEMRSQVERWLTETLERQLYSVSDIEGRLTLLVPAIN